MTSYPAELEPLPFPPCKENDAFSLKIIALVERAREIEKVSDNTKDDRDRTALQSAFDTILLEIDSLVCDAYGLSSEDSRYIKNYLTAKPASSK